MASPLFFTCTSLCRPLFVSAAFIYLIVTWTLVKIMKNRPAFTLRPVSDSRKRREGKRKRKRRKEKVSAAGRRLHKGVRQATGAAFRIGNEALEIRALFRFGTR